MSQILRCMVLVTLVGGWSLPAFAGEFYLEQSMGTNHCISNGLASCSQVDFGFASHSALGYRWKYIGLNTRFDYFTQSIAAVSSSTLGSSGRYGGAELQLILPLELIHYTLKAPTIVDPSMKQSAKQNLVSNFVSFSIGWGYSDLALRDSTIASEVSWRRILGNILYSLSYFHPLYTHLGITGMLSYLPRSQGQRCIIYDGSGPCLEIAKLEPNEQDISASLQLLIGVQVYY